MSGRLARLGLEAVLVSALVLAAVAVNWTNHGLEARMIERKADGDVGPLPDGNVVRVLSLGFERVVADLAWIRTAYYIGDEVSSEAHWPAAERLGQFVTDIDPYFDSAYVTMSSVLNGLRSDPDAAIRLLEKGAPHSKYWRLHFLLGFQYFMEKGEYEKGAKSLELAHQYGGPPYLVSLISRLYATGGDVTSAMQFVAARLQNEESPEIRAKLEERFSDLWITRDLDAIDAAIEKYRDARHKDPKTIAELVAGGFLPTEPRDPKGGAYRLADGRATASIPHERITIYRNRPMRTPQ